VSLVIRAARPGESPLVLEFVRELAEYEKLTDEVVATVELMDAALFSDRPRVFCEIAEWDGAPAGFALWFSTFTSFKCRPAMWLEDIFVRPGFRRRGIAKELLAHLARRCVAQGFVQIEWAVLDWNTPAIGFYGELGAKLATEWTMCRLSNEPLRELAASS
jgi:GNAT superfamily N-acetyltransferase